MTTWPLIGLALGCRVAPDPAVPPACGGSPTLTWQNFGDGYVRTWCAGCHSAGLDVTDRSGAPVGLDFDTWAEVSAYASRIDRVATGDAPRMPPAGGPTADDRAMLHEWLACGAPGADPPAPPCASDADQTTGTAVIDARSPEDAVCSGGRGIAIGGDLEVRADSPASLDCVCSVDGDVIVDGSTAVALAAPALAVIGGDLRIASNAALDRVALGALVSVGGEVRVSGNPALATLGLGALADVGGPVAIVDDPALGDLGLPRLLTVGGDLELARNPALWTANLARVASVAGKLAITDHEMLAVVVGDLENVDHIDGDVVISGNRALVGLYGFLYATSLGGDVVVTDNPALTELRGFHDLTGLAGRLVVADDPALTWISGFDAVQAIGGIEVDRVAALTALDGFAALTAVDRDVRVQGAPLLRTLGLAPGLTAIGGTLQVTATGATRLSELAALDTVGGDLILTDNPALPDQEAFDLRDRIGESDIGGDVVISGNGG